MSKIVIMNVADGKVSYIKGDEVVVNISDLENRLSEIDKELEKGKPDYLEAIRSLEGQAEKAIANKTKEIDKKVEELKKELDDYIETINFELENSKEVINRKAEVEDEAYSNLIKEKNGLLAILDNVITEKEVEVKEEVKTEPEFFGHLEEVSLGDIENSTDTSDNSSEVKSEVKEEMVEPIQATQVNKRIIF